MTSLYRRHRPQTFDEVVGQAPVGPTGRRLVLTLLLTGLDFISPRDQEATKGEFVRTRSKAVALSISLVIAASGGGTASASPQPSSTGKDVAPASLQDAGPALGDDERAPGDAPTAGNRS